MGTGVVRASGPSLTPFEGTLPVTRSGYVPSPSAPACFISPQDQVHPADNRLGPRADFHYLQWFCCQCIHSFMMQLHQTSLYSTKTSILLGKGLYINWAVHKALAYIKDEWQPEHALYQCRHLCVQSTNSQLLVPLCMQHKTCFHASFLNNVHAHSQRHAIQNEDIVTAQTDFFNTVHTGLQNSLSA